MNIKEFLHILQSKPQYMQEWATLVINAKNHHLQTHQHTTIYRKTLLISKHKVN